MPRQTTLRRRATGGASTRRAAIGAIGAVAAVALLLGGLTGCAAGMPGPAQSRAVQRRPPVSASPSPAVTFAAQGTADGNLPVFAAAVAHVWESADRGRGKAYVDALTAVGFDKRAMQVTSDMSTVGNPAESIEFSVRWGDRCLVGQVGPAIGHPVTAVLPVLGGGVCLLGQTRPIDW